MNDRFLFGSRMLPSFSWNSALIPFSVPTGCTKRISDSSESIRVWKRLQKSERVLINEAQKSISLKDLNIEVWACLRVADSAVHTISHPLHHHPNKLRTLSRGCQPQITAIPKWGRAAGGLPCRAPTLQQSFWLFCIKNLFWTSNCVFRFHFLIFSSRVRFQISDDVGSVLGVGQTSEGHGVTWSVVGWGLQVLIQVLLGPLATLAWESTTAPKRDHRQ